MALNRIVLVGRLTKDPEMKYTPAGVPVAQLSVAVNRVTKNDAGEYETDFFDVVAWRRTAEFASNYLTKGRLVSIDGRLQTRSWVAQDGTKRKAYEIVADNLEGLDRKGDGDGGGGGGGYAGNGADAGMEAPAPQPMAAQAAPRPAAAAPNSRPTAGGRAMVPAPAEDDLDEADPFADE